MCSGGRWGMCSIAPVPEVCDGLDNDCNGSIDDGVRITCYADGDNDTYAAGGAPPITQCPVGGRAAVGGCPVNYTNRPPVAPGEDCNDSDSTIAPGSVEVCNMRDDDCDSSIDDGVGIVCYADGDRDTYASMSAPGMMSCPVSGTCPFGFTTRMPVGATTSDCNDSVMTVFPGALEACDGIDNDCSGVIDDGMRVACFNDGDDDGYPPMGAASMMFCPDSSRASVGGCPTNRTHRSPTVAANRDCNDVDRDIHPGATELCDGIDNDCNGSDDAMRVRCFADGDLDGYPPAGASSSMECPDPARMAVGFCPVNRTNRDPATAANVDCDDSNPGFGPGVMEMCSVPAVDQNCNGTADEGIVTCYADGDRDGFAPTGAAMLAPACAITGGYGGCGLGYTSRNPATAGNADCDDVMALVNPLGAETCNSVDDNCNGTIDEGFYIDRMYYRDRDRDGYGVGSLTTVSWPSCATTPPFRYAAVAGDCCDTDGAAHPGSAYYGGTPLTICGGYDYDCDGSETLMPAFPMACTRTFCSTLGCVAAIGASYYHAGVCTPAATCGAMTAGCQCSDFCSSGFCINRTMSGFMVPQPCR
jgi:large repetitive protein